MFGKIIYAELKDYGKSNTKIAQKYSKLEDYQGTRLDFASGVNPKSEIAYDFL